LGKWFSGTDPERHGERLSHFGTGEGDSARKALLANGFKPEAFVPIWDKRVVGEEVLQDKVFCPDCFNLGQRRQPAPLEFAF
jgi:hypothetical protein